KTRHALGDPCPGVSDLDAEERAPVKDAEVSRLRNRIAELEQELKEARLDGYRAYMRNKMRERRKLKKEQE
ncbi:hypothetical protein KGP36_06845, partial [Patescibacteria group bacterium]|nr:hypothetical protein [Patescibacteria group bacterium]